MCYSILIIPVQYEITYRLLKYILFVDLNYNMIIKLLEAGNYITSVPDQNKLIFSFSEAFEFTKKPCSCTWQK